MLINKWFIGRIDRTTFFIWAILLAPLYAVAAGLIGAVISIPLGGIVDFDHGFVRYLIVGLVAGPFAFYFFSLFVRRLKDIGHSPWLVLLWLIPAVNIAFLLYLALKPGQPKENPHGLVPGQDAVTALYQKAIENSKG